MKGPDGDLNLAQQSLSQALLLAREQLVRALRFTISFGRLFLTKQKLKTIVYNVRVFFAKFILGNKTSMFHTEITKNKKKTKTKTKQKKLKQTKQK